MISNRSDFSQSSPKGNLKSSESSRYEIIGPLGSDTEISKDNKTLLSNQQPIEKNIPPIPPVPIIPIIPLNLPFPSSFPPSPFNPIIRQPPNLDTIPQPNQIFQPPNIPIIQSPFIAHSNPPELSYLVNQENVSIYLPNSSENIPSQDPFQSLPDKNFQDPFIKHPPPIVNQNVHSPRVFMKFDQEIGLNHDNSSMPEEYEKNKTHEENEKHKMSEENEEYKLPKEDEEHKMSEAAEEFSDIEINEERRSIIKISNDGENLQMHSIDMTLNESSGSPLDKSSLPVKIFIYQKCIIRYSRLSRIFIVIHTVISLIYMLPIPVLLPILLVDVFGFISVMFLNFLMCFSFAILLGLCLTIRFAMTICLGKYIGDYTANNDHDILSLAFAVFIILDIMELGFFIFLYKMYTLMSCFDKNRLGETLKIMKNKDYGWKKSLMNI